jgi:hypothetical protein
MSNYIFLQLGSVCKYEDLATMSPSPPDFMTPNIQAGDVISAGLHVTYTCITENTMVPFDVDQDSNYAMEVFCVDGNFIAPIWPTECITEAVCTTVPTPTSTLERSDNRTKFRAGEFAYFTCKVKKPKSLHFHILTRVKQQK